MWGKYLLPLLAIIGLAVAIGAVIKGNQAPRGAAPIIASPDVPYKSYVAGAGIVEASTGNIAIGTPVSGVVIEIDVKWDEQVAAGRPLFKIDDRDLQGQLLPAAARVKVAQANLAKTKNLLKIAEGLSVGSSISAIEMDNRRYDVDIKEAELASATAQVERLKIEIDRRTIKAPMAGRILQINTRLGEFAQSGVVNPPLMVLGDTGRLYLRVNVDENDAWRIRADAPALAFVRGNPDMKTPLTFERFDPYVVPKVSLTGQSTERTDMRVLPVIYSFPGAALPVYVGQQMDAFIAAPPVAGTDLAKQHPSAKAK